MMETEQALTEKQKERISAELRAVHQALHELSVFARRQERRFAKRMKSERDFCRDYLKRWTEENQTDAPELNPVAIAIVKSMFYQDLARAEDCLGNREAAEEALFAGLAQAQRSRDEDTLYSSLSALGWFFGMHEEYDRAILYFQRTLAYARGSWPHHLISTLENLGWLWSKREPTLSIAIAMFDWICQLRPTAVDSLIHKYECLVRLGETEAVRAAATHKEFTSCMEAATTFAARLALGRRKRACAAAEEGLRIAESAADKGWQSSFRYLLDKYNRPRAPQPSEPAPTCAL